MNRLRLRIVTETEEEQNEAGRYHPGFVLLYRGRRIPLSCGSSDNVCGWSRKGTALFIMSYNLSLGYAGLQEFIIEPKEKYFGAGDKVKTTDGFFEGDSVFFQHDWDMPEDFFDWAEHKMLDYLHQHLQ